MIERSLSPSTRTVELVQLAEVDAALHAPAAPAVTAGELGLLDDAYTAGEPVGGLPANAVLARVSWDGPPGYPYVHGHFAAGPGQGEAYRVDLHTSALRELSHRLHLHHSWGA